MNETKEKMMRALENIERQFSSIRTGRASPDLLSRIQVNYYGSTVPLVQVGNVSAPEPQMLMINVFDQQAVKDVEKAILVSDLNLNPQVDGNMVRLRLPDLTEDRRKELAKIVRRNAEDGKIVIRNIRRGFLEELKAQEKNSEITEDDLKKGQQDIQKETDDFIKKIDDMVSAKESEIMTV